MPDREIELADDVCGSEKLLDVPKDDLCHLRRLFLGRERFDLREDVEADQADQDDRHTIAVQREIDWLAEGNDPENHDPD
jgi:hypothetical protein